MAAKLFAENAMCPGNNIPFYLENTLLLIKTAIEEIRNLSSQLTVPEFAENGLLVSIRELTDLLSQTNIFQIQICAKKFDEKKIK